MGGKKRQETTSSLRSSSGRRDLISPAPAVGRRSQTHQQHVKAVNVGCMSSIFHLVSKYHTRRKFLTFGKKPEKQVPSPTPSKPETTTTTTCQSRDHDSSETAGRSSLEVPRSPVIPAEIRNPGTANSPRVVARLMGIDDAPASPLAASASAEKRRKLLGALEKCDEDLKALKRIIEAVRASQTPPRVAVHGGCGKGERREKGVEDEVAEEADAEEREDEPSPVSVLDFSQSPPMTSYSKRTRPYGQELKQQHMQKQERQRTTRKLELPGEEDHSSNFCFLNRSSLTSTNPVISITTLASVFLLPPSKTRPLLIDGARRRTRPPSSTLLPWSKAVVESVEEVCRDVECGERLEVGGIGLLIQDFIFKDLLEEFTKDMMLMMMRRRRSCDYVFSSSRVIGLPFEACKRKLCF